MSLTAIPELCGPCALCGSDLWLPRELYNAARKSKDITFYCAFGHPQHFPQGDSEATILRRERDRALQQIAEKEDELRELQGQRDELKAQVERLIAAKGKDTETALRIMSETDEEEAR